MALQTEQTREDDESIALQTEQPQEDDESMALQTEQPQEDDESLALQTEQPQEDDECMALQTEQIQEDDESMALQTEQSQEDDEFIALQTEQPQEDDESMALQTEQPLEDDESMALQTEPPLKDDESMALQTEQPLKDDESMALQFPQQQITHQPWMYRMQPWLGPPAWQSHQPWQQRPTSDWPQPWQSEAAPWTVQGQVRGTVAHQGEVRVEPQQDQAVLQKIAQSCPVAISVGEIHLTKLNSSSDRNFAKNLLFCICNEDELRNHNCTGKTTKKDSVRLPLNPDKLSWALEATKLLYPVQGALFKKRQVENARDAINKGIKDRFHYK